MTAISDATEAVWYFVDLWSFRTSGFVCLTKHDHRQSQAGFYVNQENSLRPDNGWQTFNADGRPTCAYVMSHESERLQKPAVDEHARKAGHVPSSGILGEVLHVSEKETAGNSGHGCGGERGMWVRMGPSLSVASGGMQPRSLAGRPATCP